MNQLWKKQASVAYGFSLTRLALNEYMYLEDRTAEDTQEQIRQYDLQFHKLLALHLDKKDCLDQVMVLRGSLLKEMEIIVALTDIFRIYEYALNRIERKFKMDAPAVEENDHVMTEQLLAFLTGADDAAVMNQRIQMVIGQLPVRFTRQKFYSLVREALSVYIGSDYSALENMMYQLRTGAMVALSQDQSDQYPQLKQLWETLKKLDFKTMTAEEFHNAEQLILIAGEQLYVFSERYQLLQEMINDLYVLILTEREAMRDQQEEQSALALIRLLLKQYQGENEEISEDMVLDYLHQLEGSQEHYYEKYQRLEGAPQYQDGEPEWADKSRRVERLLSTSSFADLDLSCDDRIVDTAVLDQITDTFFAQLGELFLSSKKPVVRAVMATVLSSLPICFNSLDEVGNYISGSLASCSDPNEKDTCKELLQQIMESDGYALL